MADRDDRVARGRRTSAARVEPPRPRRVSRQREAGEATRRETRRRLLVAARAEFAERGYAAATVIRIAERADVSVQTLFSNWGNKRNLLRGVMESAVTGDDDIPLEAGQPPAVLTAGLDPGDAKDPSRLPAAALRPGLTPAAAADTAWVIASPDTHDQLVRQAGSSYDQLEAWVRNTLSAALLAGG